MKLSSKSPNRFALILATALVTTGSIVLANRSGQPTSKSQETSRHIVSTKTSRSNRFVENNLAKRTSPLALPTATPTPTPSPIYRVIELIPATGFPRFVPYDRGLGEHGEILGRMVIGQGPLSAAIWRNGVVQEIPTSNALNSIALDINESNQIVGRAYFEPDDPQVRGQHPAAYILPDTPLPNPVVVRPPGVNPLIDFQFAEASANNNVGQVIGYYQTNTERGHLGYQALLWDTTVPGNPFRILDPLPGDSESRPFDINDNGTVVGESGNGLRIFGESRAIVWKNDRVIDVGNPPGFNRCKATRINSFEFVVGVCENTVERQGFLWHDDNSNGESDTGELRLLQQFPPDSSYIHLCDINDQGQLTAGKFIYGDDNSNGLPDAGETKDLNSLIDTSYGIHFTHAINNRGQILAFGFKRDAQGVNVGSRYLLLDPLPEPVIFVPGIAGSMLVDHPGSGGDELRPKLSANHRRLTLFPADNPSEDIEATDAIRYGLPNLRMVPIYELFFKYLREVGEFREYQVGDPSKRTTAGCDLTQKRDDPNLSPNFFVFAYDWRKSNVENAAKLTDYVGCVRLFHPDTKINIVAHSMGGLLSRRYILDNPNDHNITRLITVGTPWLGAPKALRVLETGEFIELGPIYISVADIKYIAPSLLGAHQLLPSRAYQDLGAPPIFVKSGWDYDDTGEEYESYDYNRVRQFLDLRYLESMPGTVGPGTTGHLFHSYSTASGKQDDWRSDSTGVNYFHFYGVQSEENTVTQLVAKVAMTCRSVASPLPSPFIVCYPQHVLDPVYSKGDGTVPEISGSRSNPLLDLNAPNAKVFRVTNENDDLAEHVKMFRNSAIHSAILKLLRGGTVPSSISSAAPRRSAERRYANHAQATDSSSTPSYYVSIIGCSSVVVTDTQGNSTAPVEGDLMGSVPDVALFSMAADAKMISLPVSTTEQHTITFNVSDKPLALRIVKGENNVRPAEVTHYQDIDLPAGVSAKLVFSPAGFENLRYDSNGDGTYDAIVSPTIVLSGSAALDTTAPTLAFAESRQDPTIAQVTITAADSGTGVRDVYYSTDGSQFQAYTSALSLDPIQTPRIFAFATDGAGNRSPMVTYPVGSPPISIRGTVKNHADNLLSGATITLRGTASATVRTDINGNYEFANLPAGGYYGLSASLSGFGFSSDDRIVSNPIADKTVDFIGEGACNAASVTSQPTAQTVCEGSTASFSVTATGTNLSFQWRKNGAPLSNDDNVSGADSATLTIDSAGPADADTYDVVITASCAPSAASNAARLIVIPFTDNDGDGQGDCIDLDDDNDGQKDVDENTCGSDPLVASSLSPDLDRDNEPDCVDADDDNDGFTDADENSAGSDPRNSASTPEQCDGLDNDLNEGTDERFPNTDGDSLANCIDLDDDNDGQTDTDESACGSNPLDTGSKAPDTDRDNQPDCVDADDDNDTVVDAADNCQFAANTDQLNTDRDAQGDACDLDDDNDGTADTSDNCPLTANANQANTDGDAFGDVCDPDDDNDGDADATDCARFNAAIHHGATEVCNGLDDDCDGAVDEGVKTTFFRDADNDGYGNAAVFAQSCTQPPGYVVDSIDCNDSNTLIHPGATEVCDGLDNDCDTSIDGGFTDTDADGRADCVDTDDDNDGLADTADNCPLVTNSDQADSNGDGIGDVCAVEIVFVSDRVGNNEIYGMRADGTGVVRLTDNVANEYDPALSPDGSKIAFVSTRAGNREIYLMNADGSDERRRTISAGPDIQPAWSPDGSQIVFTSYRDGNYEIYVMNADGSDVRRLTTNGGTDDEPDWGTNGKIVFVSTRHGNREIYVMNADGSEVTRRTISAGSDSNPSWAPRPNHNRIVFTSVRDGNPEIYSMKASGLGLHNLTNNPATDASPAWGANGKIVFVSTRDGNREIYVMNENGTNVRRRTTHPASDDAPHW